MEEVETDIWDEVNDDVEITDMCDTSIHYDHCKADEMPLYYDDMEWVPRDSRELCGSHDHFNACYLGGASETYKRHWDSKDNFLDVVSNRTFNEMLKPAPEVENDTDGLSISIVPHFVVPFSDLKLIPKCKEPSFKERYKDEMKNQLRIYKYLVYTSDLSEDESTKILIDNIKTFRHDKRHNVINLKDR